MASRFYLRNTAAGTSPSAGSKSAVLTDSGSGPFEGKSLSRTAGSAVVWEVSTEVSGGAPEDDYLLRCASAGLRAQTIAAANWTVAISVSEDDAGMDSRASFSIYVWNPGGSSVRGYIYDSATRLGSEWVAGGGTGEDGRTYTISGSAVVVSASDILVIEVWRTCDTDTSGGGVSAYVSYDGATAVVDGVANAAAASYLEYSGSVYLTGEPIANAASLSGSVTPSGTLRKAVAVSKAGSVTPSGTLSKAVAKPLAGSVTASGTLRKAVAKAFAGSVTPTGALAKAVGKALSGSVTPSGTITKAVGKTLSGSVTAVGALAKAVAKAFAGSVSPSGVIAKAAGKVLGGSVTPSGTLSNQFTGLGTEGHIVAYVVPTYYITNHVEPKGLITARVVSADGDIKTRVVPQGQITARVVPTGEVKARVV